MAVVGSPRATGNTSYLVDVALDELARRGVAVEKITLGEHRILPCEGHDDCADFGACPLNDEAGPILERVYAADGLIFATPVYYENVSGQMKLFIDRNCFNNYHEIWLRARAVGLIAVAESTGLDDAIDGLRRYVSLACDKKIKPLSVSDWPTAKATPPRTRPWSPRCATWRRPSRRRSAPTRRALKPALRPDARRALKPALRPDAASA